LIFAGVIDKFEINPNDKGLSYPFVWKFIVDIGSELHSYRYEYYFF
jgi:hypothetical protein